MTPEEADRIMQRLAAECDRMAERLVALDGHEGQRLLDGASLTGQSQRRWAAAKAAIGRLWVYFQAYRDALAAARALRGRRPSADDLARLGALLTGQLIELPPMVPLPPDEPDEPDEPGPTAAGSEWVGFAELTQRMNDDYATVMALVTAAARAWSTLARRLDLLAERLASAEAVAASLGLTDDPELAAVRAELVALGSADFLRRPEASGPATASKINARVCPDSTMGISADISGDHGGHGPLDERIRAAGVRLDAAVERLTRLRRARDGYPELRAGLVARAEEVAAAQAEEAELHETVRVRIASAPALPGDGGGDGDVAGRLRGAVDELDILHRRQDWERLAARHAELEELAAGALASARAATDNLRELLDRRSELRGRLDAYRAKAGRLGHGEDATLSDLHRRARELLWAAPCDLAAATRAVASYQQAVLTATAQGGDIPP
jgi:hypothetical protein